jgi:hypothetical protein
MTSALDRSLRYLLVLIGLGYFADALLVGLRAMLPIVVIVFSFVLSVRVMVAMFHRSMRF